MNDQLTFRLTVKPFMLFEISCEISALQCSNHGGPILASD